jgi:DNA-binding CsgD family transcriptional regulator
MRATLYPELVEKIGGLGRRGQVLAGIWAGKGTKEIAADMGLSPKTVEYHRAQLYRVFGVNDLVSLCRRAIAVGLINPQVGSRSPKAGSGGRDARGNAHAFADRGTAGRVSRHRERRPGANTQKTEHFEGFDA